MVELGIRSRAEKLCREPSLTKEAASSQLLASSQKDEWVGTYVFGIWLPPRINLCGSSARQSGMTWDEWGGGRHRAIR